MRTSAAAGKPYVTVVVGIKRVGIGSLENEAFWQLKGLGSP